jgi:hypothetical protein
MRLKATGDMWRVQKHTVTFSAAETHPGGCRWEFEYAVRDSSMQDVTVFKVESISSRGGGSAGAAAGALQRFLWRMFW